MYLVDWEYAGMNDPMWDLGDLAVEAGFGPEQDETLLGAYFDGAPPPAERGRMVLAKGLCDLVWTLWGLLQVMNDNPVEDFWAYSINRFERCQRLMASDDVRSGDRSGPCRLMRTQPPVSAAPRRAPTSPTMLESAPRAGNNAQAEIGTAKHREAYPCMHAARSAPRL